ncbi:MAG: Ig-like domain-containing protein, partial [Candidatus Odinarchaeota archaeon]
PMARVTGNTYEATISSLVWGTYQYYVNAIDAFGKSVSALNGSSYYSFISTDIINPSVVFDAPSNGSTVNGTVLVNITAIDLESGLASMNVSIDGISVLNRTLNGLSSQYTIEWDTTAVENDLHEIIVTVHDVAGNSVQSTLAVTVDNSEPPDLLALLLVVAIIVAGVLVMIVVVIYIHKR